jgi:hypothetical protein
VRPRTERRKDGRTEGVAGARRRKNRRAFIFGLTLVGSALVAACSDITDDGSGVIALEVQPPVPAVVEVGDTFALVARALDRDGNPVDVAIEWRTPDPANVFVEPTTGRIAGLTPGTSGRVQAIQGSLVSDLIALTVVARADTLEVPPDTLTVDPASTTSPALAPRVARLVEGVYVGVAGRSMIFEIVEPVFADVASRTVEITGTGALADTVLTGGDGLPQGTVTLSRITGLTAPDTVEVAVRVLRPSGALVPGSGQRFVVAFQ